MNYRHSFHAGNFADLHKHAVLLLLMRALRSGDAPMTIVDTHAGAGVYDLSNSDQARSKEAERGVQRLMAGDLPGAFRGLVEAVEGLNNGGSGPLYPGSPWLIVGLLGEEDRYVGCELNAPVRDDLAAVLARTSVPGEARLADGYETAQTVADEGGRLFVLIDPPYERGDDYRRAAETAGAVLRADPGARLAVWTPLKDLETLDGFLRDLKAKTRAEVVVSEVRLRPLSDPMKMNGSAMVLVNPPAGLDGEIAAVGEALVSVLGDPGGEARLWRA